MKKTMLAVCVFMLLCAPALRAEQQTAIFISSDGNLTGRTLSEAAAAEIAATLHGLGRFRPFERNRYAADTEAEGDSVAQAERIAGKMGASLLIIISAYQSGNYSFGELRLQPLDNSGMSAKRFQVRTTVMNNVPLLLAREVAQAVAAVPVKAAVLSRENNISMIDAGAWHGLKPGDTLSTAGGGKAVVVQTGQYFSWVRTDDDAGPVVIGPSRRGDSVTAELLER
jgi:hypothetical protein